MKDNNARVCITMHIFNERTAAVWMLNASDLNQWETYMAIGLTDATA